MPAPEKSLFGGEIEIGSEPRSDGGMIHGVVKGLCPRRHHTELPRLLLREPAGEPWSRRLRLRHRQVRIRPTGCFVVCINVIRFGGPTEQRGPPVGVGASSAVGIGFTAVGGGTCLDSDSANRSHGGCHFGNLICVLFFCLGICIFGNCSRLQLPHAVRFYSLIRGRG